MGSGVTDWPDEDRWCRKCGMALNNYGDCPFCDDDVPPDLKLVRDDEDEPEE